METEEKQLQEQQARAVAVEITSIIREMLPQLRAELSPESLPRLLAAGALARQLCLLEGMIAICDAGQARIAGLIMRAQWETQLVGLYCMLANKEAAKALVADRAYWAKGIERTWNLEGSWHDKTERMAKWYGEVQPKRLNFTDLAGEIERLLKDKGYPADITTAHQRLYKGESTFTSHPGFEALIRNLKTDGTEWMPDVSFEPIPSHAAYLCNCAWSAAGLAELLLEALGLSPDRLNAAMAKVSALGDPQR